MSLIYYSSNIRLGGLDGFPLSTYMNSDLLTYLLPTPTPRDLLLDMILINLNKLVDKFYFSSNLSITR